MIDWQLVRCYFMLPGLGIYAVDFSKHSNDTLNRSIILNFIAFFG